jgi:hypothetical protein
MYGNDLEQEVIWSSEVFRNFLKETENQSIKDLDIEKRAFEEYQDSLNKMKERILNNPVLKKAFLEMREKAIHDPSFREQVGDGITDSLIILDI